MGVVVIIFGKVSAMINRDVTRANTILIFISIAPPLRHPHLIPPLRLLLR